MKTRGRAYIEIEIGVMHIMKPPEERDHVISPVPPPIGVIHEQKGCDDYNPSRQRQPIQQTKMSILHPHRDRQRDWQHEKPNNCKSGNRKNKIAGQPAQRAEMLSPKRELPLQQEQHEKNAAEERTSDIVP